jgi:hypothetical protein
MNRLLPLFLSIALAAVLACSGSSEDGGDAVPDDRGLEIAELPQSKSLAGRDVVEADDGPWTIRRTAGSKDGRGGPGRSARFGGGFGFCAARSLRLAFDRVGGEVEGEKREQCDAQSGCRQGRGESKSRYFARVVITTYAPPADAAPGHATVEDDESRQAGRDSHGNQDEQEWGLNECDACNREQGWQEQTADSVGIVFPANVEVSLREDRGAQEERRSRIRRKECDGQDFEDPHRPRNARAKTGGARDPLGEMRLIERGEDEERETCDGSRHRMFDVVQEGDRRRHPAAPGGGRESGAQHPRALLVPSALSQFIHDALGMVNSGA